MKYAVGVMLSAYGVFWGAEGAGLDWPGGDVMLPILILVVFVASISAVRILRRSAGGGIPTGP